jgi:type IV secretion system protein TrbL
MACQAGAIVCGSSDALATGLSWISGVFAKGKGAVEGVKKGIEFAQDPLGFITQQMQDAVHAVAGVLIPWLLSALHPNYDAQWWLKSYAVSFSISMFVLAVQLLIITSRRRKGSLGAKEMLESIFIAAPAFLIGAAFGPVIGIALTKVFTAAGDSIAAWAVNSTTQEFFTKIAELAAADDAGALLNSAIVSMFVLGTLFLSLLGVAFIFIIQLATQYLVGAVLPLGFVWIVNPDTRKIGKAVPIIWVVIGLTQVALILLVGLAFRAINGISITADPGTLGKLVNPIQTFVNLAVPAVISFIVVFAPLSMLKFIPRPGGGGGTARTSGFTPPQMAPQIPNTPSHAPQTAHQTAASQPAGQSGGGYQWNMPTAPAQVSGGYGGQASQVGSAGNAAAAGGGGGGGAVNATASAASTAGKHAAGAAGAAGKAGAAGGAGAAAAAGTASTGVGAPLAVGMLLANSALKVAQQASQAASTAAEQAVEHGTHQEA